jgi:GMP synthase-like glutamine amidotransferase
MNRRVGLLVVGHVDPASVHVAGDYPELYRNLLEPLGVDIVPFACADGDLPASLDDCDGWLCSPSRSSAYDDDPWIGDTEQLLRQLMAEERLFVGICFGHQLLAQALGGRVSRAEAGWGVGAQVFDVVRPQWWMEGATTSIRLVASHQDQVVDLPPEAEVWLSSPYCPNGGLIVGERAWTLQLHPEFTAELADSLLQSRTELLGADTVERARSSLAQPLDRHLVAHWIARTFGAA